MELIKTGNSSLLKFKFEKINYLKKICDEINDKLKVKPEIYIYNKICRQKRNVGFFSNKSKGYYYSGKLAKSIPLTKKLEKLMAYINKIFESNFNGILINKYCDGNDYISAHCDDEKNIGICGVVAISYGATRLFRIRDKKTKNIVLDCPLESGDIIIMNGDFQKEFTHEIPIDKKVKEERYSLTFRHHLV